MKIVGTTQVKGKLAADHSSRSETDKGDDVTKAELMRLKGERLPQETLVFLVKKGAAFIEAKGKGHCWMDGDYEEFGKVLEMPSLSWTQMGDIIRTYAGIPLEDLDAVATKEKKPKKAQSPECPNTDTGDTVSPVLEPLSRTVDDNFWQASVDQVFGSTEALKKALGKTGGKPLEDAVTGSSHYSGKNGISHIWCDVEAWLFENAALDSRDKLLDRFDEAIGDGFARRGEDYRERWLATQKGTRWCGLLMRRRPAQDEEARLTQEEEVRKAENEAEIAAQNPPEARIELYEKMDKDALRLAYHDLNTRIGNLATSAEKAVESLTPLYVEMRTLLSQRGKGRAKVLKDAGCPSWYQWSQSFAKRCQVTVRTCQRHAKLLTEGAPMHIKTTRPQDDGFKPLKPAEQRKLAKAAVVGTELVKAVEDDGSDLPELVKEYKSLALTQDRLDSVLDGGGPDYEGILRCLIADLLASPSGLNHEGRMAVKKAAQAAGFPLHGLSLDEKVEKGEAA